MKKLVIIFYLLASFNLQAQKHTIKIQHKYYAIYFDTLIKLPLYTYYDLPVGHLTSKVKRSGTFHPDATIANRYQWTNKQYSHTGYDKGHLCNDKINRFDLRAESDCMTLTNVAPQNKAFNEHLWLAVENAERDSCTKYKDLHCYTGVIYGNQKVNGMSKPDYYWKVIETAKGKFIAAWMGANVTPKSFDSRKILTNKKVIEAKTKMKF